MADAPATGITTRLRRGFRWIAVFWTLLILALTGWRYYSDRESAWLMAKNLAQESYNKDILYRRWASQHGGVYVPITEQTPPNPHLDVPERDITTPSGKALTLINPAYMTRQVHELGAKHQGIHGHLTSLHPIRPDNAPDAWERRALEAFEQGVQEITALERLEGQPFLRFMRPMITEKACLKCHAIQGYQEGQIRGGISISAPWQPYRQVLHNQMVATGISHSIIWALGLVGLWLAYWRLRAHLTERQQAEHRINHLAYYDALTDLPNRALLTQRADVALALAARHNEALAVLFLDLDRFKDINDSLGHVQGDELLMQTAHRLCSLVREVDTLARLGGDGFVLLLPDAALEGARRVADKILAAFREPFTVATHRLHVTLSVGIALYPHDGGNFDELLKNADTALYRAKEAGRNTQVFYAREMNMASVARLTLETELRQAIEHGHLRAWYQPKLRLADGALAGAEALVRWQHPQRGLIPPNQFIPVAEASDLIVALGDWMLEDVCRQLALWREAGLPPLNVAVNLAARHFRKPQLVGHIVDLLATYGLTAGALELELTESTLLETGGQTTEVLQALKQLGVGLAIDDFGTGYSSLSYLKRLPITALKIDQRFVRDLETDAEDRTLARTIVALGHGLGLKVVAEGVETEQQRRILLEQGCDLAQGYLFSRPLPAEEFTQWLAQQSLSRGLSADLSTTRLTDY